MYGTCAYCGESIIAQRDGFVDSYSGLMFHYQRASPLGGKGDPNGNPFQEVNCFTLFRIREGAHLNDMYRTLVPIILSMKPRQRPRTTVSESDMLDALLSDLPPDIVAGVRDFMSDPVLQVILQQLRKH